MTETIRPDRHRRRPARPAGRGRRRAAGRDAGRHRRRLPRGPRAAGRGGQLRAQDLGRRRADRLDRAGRRRRPPGPGLHARPGRLEHPRGRADQDRPGHPVDRHRRSSPGVLEVTKNAVLVGTGHARRPARRGQGPRAASRWPPPTGPAASGLSPATASVTLEPAMSRAGHPRGRRRDLRRPPRDRARHVLGRRADLEGAGAARRARASCSTAPRTRPRSTPRPGRCTTTCW